MKQPERTSVGKLSTLIIIGLIMVLVPVNTALIMFFFSLFRNNEYTVFSSVEGPSTVYLEVTLPGNLSFIGLAVFVCGLIILGYAGVKRFLQRKSGEEK